MLGHSEPEIHPTTTPSSSRNRMFAHAISSSPSHRTDPNHHVHDPDFCTTSSWDHTSIKSLSDSPTMMTRIRRRMRRNCLCSSKFHSLARQEQRQLAEEIKTCKHYVRNLQNVYKIRQHAKDTSILHVFAREHATDLSEEIQLCQEELKFEESLHSLDCSRRRGMLRDCSCPSH